MHRAAWMHSIWSARKSGWSAVGWLPDQLPPFHVEESWSSIAILHVQVDGCLACVCGLLMLCVTLRGHARTDKGWFSVAQPFTLQVDQTTQPLSNGKFGEQSGEFRVGTREASVTDAGRRVTRLSCWGGQGARRRLPLRDCGDGAALVATAVTATEAARNGLFVCVSVACVDRRAAWRGPWRAEDPAVAMACATCSTRRADCALGRGLVTHWNL
jgi:hypothetical protein